VAIQLASAWPAGHQWLSGVAILGSLSGQLASLRYGWRSSWLQPLKASCNTLACCQRSLQPAGAALASARPTWRLAGGNVGGAGLRIAESGGQLLGSLVSQL